jgi:hypothetical protein
METLGSFETSVTTFRTKQRHLSEDLKPQQYRCSDITSVKHTLPFGSFVMKAVTKLRLAIIIIIIIIIIDCN